MSVIHTLREQSAIIPACSTFQEKADLIAQFLVNNLGLSLGDSSENTYKDIFLDSQNNLKLRLKYYNNNIDFYYGSSSSIYDNMGSTTVVQTASETSIKYHISTKKDVKYFSINNIHHGTVIIAKNKDGQESVLKGINSGSSAYWMINNQTGYYTYNSAVNTSGNVYAIHKAIDYKNQSEFSELYCIDSCPIGLVNGMLVNFNGTIYRFVSLGQNSSYMNFAFPVSDEA